MSALWRTLAIDGGDWKFVAIQNDHMFEKPSQRPGRRQTTHAGADYDGLPADHHITAPVYGISERGKDRVFKRRGQLSIACTANTLNP
jgi:hypothetical protein